MANLNQLILPSPAKVNHFLHIVGQREDGYHLLQTLFQFVDYGDTLYFTLREDNKIEILPANLLGIPQESNLIYKAALALQKESGTKLGVSIQVEKKLPTGAGLGGGSSNAATTLMALNLIWKLNYSHGRLISIGKTLGSDIPVFLLGQSAFGEGTGTDLTPTLMAEPWVVVVCPECEVSSAKMYAEKDLTRNTPSLKIRALVQDGMVQDLNALANDFEPLVRKRYPEVEEAFQRLSQFGKARLSGSGACVFACFDSQSEAKLALSCLSERFNTFMAQGRNYSPLHLAIREYTNSI